MDVLITAQKQVTIFSFKIKQQKEMCLFKMWDH